METVYLCVVLGTPLLICLVAVIGAHFHGAEESSPLFDFDQPHWSETEAELGAGETEQLLATINRARRGRGAAERTLQEIAHPHLHRDPRDRG